MNAQKSIARHALQAKSKIPWQFLSSATIQCEDCCKNRQCCPGHDIPEITIIRHDGAWCYVLGSHYASTGFHDYEDPMDVAQFINNKTAGPINVVIDIR